MGPAKRFYLEDFYGTIPVFDRDNTKVLRVQTAILNKRARGNLSPPDRLRGRRDLPPEGKLEPCQPKADRNQSRPLDDFKNFSLIRADL